MRQAGPRLLAVGLTGEVRVKALRAAAATSKAAQVAVAPVGASGIALLSF